MSDGMRTYLWLIPLVWIACRTPENIVINLPDVDDALLAGYRRG